MEKKNENLPEKKMEDQADNKIDIVSSTKTETENKVDSSESGSDALGLKKSVNKDEIEEGSEKVTTALKLDDNLKGEVKEYLQDELKSAVQEVKKDFLVIFGLFASFVTFLSINVQVFKNNDNVLELIGICSMTLSFVLFFALIINGMVKDREEWHDLKKPTYIIDVVFLIIGIIFLTIGSPKSSYKMREFENKIVQDSLKIISLQMDVRKLKDKIIATDSTLFRMQIMIKKKEEVPTP